MTHVVEVPTHRTLIYICGSVSKAAHVCEMFCDRYGECVTITPTNYIYTGGSESGMAIGFINYGRFPRTPKEIDDAAERLAYWLLPELNQESCSIVSDEKTIWISNREEDNR